MLRSIQLLTIVIVLVFVSSNSQNLNEELKNQIYEKMLKRLEETLPNWQIKRIKDHQNLINYKMDFKNYIMTKSNLLEGNNVKYQSFLEIKGDFEKAQHPFTFFAGEFTKDITKLPLTGKGQFDPWSGSYWPMRNAQISVRYDRGVKNTIGVWDATINKFSKYYNWKESVELYKQPDDHVQNFPSNIRNFIENFYSPSEKYDYLVGDYNYTLTRYQKWIGTRFAKDNDIPTWYGLCHGWAPAAYYFRKPLKIVTLFASDGRTRIKFFPDDIKALATAFLANSYYVTRFVGEICPFADPKDIKSDPDTGLYIDPKCSSLNPATFFLILTNQLGINGKDFVLDPAADPEKWNQPVKSYNLRYYNLLTNKFHSTAVEAKIPFAGLENSDNLFLKFLSRRANKDTDSVVGVLMEVEYALEAQPIRGDKPLRDFYQTDQYVASLELDKDNNIIGGEWRFNKHPNFAWKFDEKLPPKSVNDEKAKFNGSVADLRRITNLASETSSKGQVLKVIVDYLIEKSQ